MRKILLVIALALLMMSIGSVSATDNSTNYNLTNNHTVLDSSQSDIFNNSRNLNPATVTISGAVSDCITGKPFPGVSVKVKTLSGEQVSQTTTGLDGRYNVSFYSNETKFNVIASFSGHLSPSQQVSTILNNSTGERNAEANFRLGQPSVTIDSPGETFINESFTLQVTFDNPSSTTGFGPIVELSLPSQITFNGASYLGTNIKTYDLGIFSASGQIYNPFTQQMANGTPGYHLYILEYPFGSFTPNQPAAPVTVNCFMAANAIIGVPLNVSAVPVFRYGADALDNPLVDPPIYGSKINSIVTPTVIRLTKTATIAESETATGSNYPVTYQLVLDIATGAIVNNVTVYDLLSGNLQFLNMVNAAGGSYTAPNSNTRGGTVTVNFGTITGIAGTDKTVTYRVYAPEFNSTNQTVINPITGVSTLGPNDSWATGNYSNNTVIANGTSTNYTITLRSLAIQKTVTDLNSSNIKPTDILQYVLNFQVSDYFQFKNIVITDIIGDGQSFLSSFVPYLVINENGTSNNITFNPGNYVVTHNNSTGTWTIVFNVSQQMIDSGLDGILTGGFYNNRSDNRGAATGTIVFRSVIDIAYEDPVNFPSGDPFLTSNDETTNSVTIAGVITNSNNTVTDASATSVRIVAPTIEKKLYAVNGNVINLTNLIKAGDKLTFSLKVIVPTTNLENFTIADFLPIPFLNATQVTTNVAQGSLPDVGQWCLASDDTLSSFLGRLPTLNTSALDNKLIFNYGLVNSTDQSSRVAHILFTVNATNNPMANDLYLTNLMNIMYDNSPGSSFSDNSIISFITQEPVLNITKGILNTTGSGTISPSPTITPINGNLIGANAGDKITFVITIRNQGGWNAYNTIIKDNALSGFINFNLVSVAYGNGTLITNWTGNLTNGTGLILNNIIPANGTVLITYTVDVPSNVYPRQIINNTAQITNYSSTDGGPNYVQDPSLFQDQASVTVADPVISKNLINSTDNGTSGNNLTIGEQGTFRITITLPEGQIRNLNISDILPAGLGFAGNYIIDTTGFNGTLGTLIFTISGNNLNFLFNGNTTILPDNNNSTDTFYIDIETVVLNNQTSNPVTNLAIPKINTVNLNWDNNPGSPVSTSYNFNVVQPNMGITKIITPNPAVGGQVVTIRLNITNYGLSPAYDVEVSDILNGTVFNWATVVANSTPSGFLFNYNSATGNVTYTGGTLLPGQNATFTFNVTLLNNLISNSSYSNTANVNYDSLNTTTIPRTENRVYNTSNSTLLRTVAPSISKSVNNTSEIDSTGNNVFIGEVVTYKITITIPSGVTKTVTIRDTLSNGLAYISGSSSISRSSTYIAADGFSFTSTNITDFQSITETTTNPSLTFFLGNITNNNPSGANETISLLFNVVVRNNASNIANRSITNTGNLTYVNATNQNLSTTANAAAITVRLPNLNVTKTASTTTPQGNESITFTIVLSNGNGAMAPVYNGVIWDILNSNFVNVRNIVVTNSTPINFNQTFDNSTGNLTITFDKLSVNQTLNIIFVADLKQNITFNQTTTNRVNVTGTSLPGTKGSGAQTPGAPGTDTGERTGDPTMPAGAVNNINATSLVTITARSPTINKTSGGSKNVNLTIGAIAPQTIVVSIPTGTTNNLRITDLIPNGLTTVGGLFTCTIGSGLSLQNLNPITSFNSTTNTWEFNFGQVNATQFSNITINYTIMVLNVVNNTNGVNLTNNATVYYQNTTGEVNGGSSTTITRVIEPDLQVIKTASTNIKPGDVCTFTINVSHKVSSTSNAYDLIVVDNIPSGMSYLTANSIPSGWTVDTSQAGKIIFNGPSISLGQNATIIFQCTVDNNTALAGTNITNIANLTYSSLNGSNPNERVYNTSGNSSTHILGADIFITKSAPATIYAGQQINFTIIVGNKGPDTAVNVVLNDIIDPVWFALMNNVQYQINSTWYTLNNPLTLNLGNISSLSNLTILVRGNINSSAPVGILNNSVNVTTDTPDPIPGNNSAQTSTTVQQLADIIIDKTGPNTVIAGNNISYNILVTNNGPSDAQNVHVEDTIPAQLINVIYSINGGVNWLSLPVGGIDLNTIVAGSNKTILINATVPASVLNGTLLNNRANATTTTPDPTPANDTVNTTVNTQSDIYVTKSAPVNAVAGQDMITYTITVGNKGPSVARNVILTDLISSLIINPIYSVDNGTNWNSWNGTLNMGNLTPGSLMQILIQGLLSSNATGTINNTALVNTTTHDPIMANNTATALTNISTVADVFVTKSGPISTVAGQDTVTYTIIVGNNGPSVARNVIVSDTIGFLNGVQYSLNGGSWNTWTGSLALGNLSSGNASTLLIRGLVPASAMGNLNNTVNVNTTTTDPYLNNNTANALTSITTVADVYITKSAPVSVIAGQALTYNLSVGNVGPSTARNVTVYDILAAEILNSQYSLNNGSTWFNWTGSLAIGDMNSGSIINILIRGNISAAAVGNINNSASVNSATFDPFLVNNTASAVTGVSAVADVFVTKSGPVSAVAGQDTITYMIVVGNIGPSMARSVVLSDAIPIMILNPFYSTNGGTSWNAWNGTLIVGDLNPGDSLQVLIRGNLSENALGIINNTAAVNSTTTDPYMVNNTASALTNVMTLADIFVIKSGPVSVVAGQDILTYVMEVGNNGPSVARNVILNDMISGFVLNPVYSMDNGTTWNTWTGSLALGNLSSGSVVDILVRGLLSSNALGTINNTAKVNTTTNDPYLTNNTASALTTVDTQADVYVIKSGPGYAVAGQDIITYTINIGNNGPSIARNVTFSDPVGFLSGVQYSLNGGSWNAWTGSLSLGNVTPGNVSTILIRGLVPANAFGILNNTATVNTTTIDPYLINNTASVITTVNTVADVYVTKMAPVSAVAGQNITYNLIVGNVGPSVARNVIISDMLAAVILNAKYSMDNGSSWNAWNGSFNAGDLNPGSVLNLLISGDVSPAAMGTINNIANVNSTTYDPDITNNTDSVVTTINTLADIYVTKNGPVIAVAGQDVINYIITVGNVGPSVARSVILTDIIPAMVLNPQYSTNGGLNWNNWTGTLDLGDMAPGDSSQVLIRGNLSENALGVINNVANVNSSTNDPYVANNTDSALTTVTTLADVYVTKFGPVSVIAGENITYNLIVGNVGPSVARNVILTDIVPVFIINTTYSSDNGTTWVSWNNSLILGDISSGSSTNIIINGLVSSGATGILNNTANVSSTTTDPYLNNNTASAITSINNVADIYIIKTGIPANAIAGRDNITYNLLIGNNGPSDALSVTLSDPISALLINPMYSLDNGTSWSAWRGSLNIGKMVSGSSVNVLISGNLAADALGIINNTATVTSPTFDPYLENNTSTALTNVNTEVDIYVRESGPAHAVAGRDNITYVIVVGNNGPSVARSVVLSDLINSAIMNPVYSLDNGTSWLSWNGSLNLGDINPGNLTNILIQGNLSASALGVINNTVMVNTTTNETYLPNNTDSVLTIVDTEADIFMNKSGTIIATAGRDNITYLISIGNNGPSVARSVILTDLVPIEILNPVYSLDNGTSWSAWLGTLNIGDINPESQLTISIMGNLSSGALGIINNTANINSSTNDPYLDNNTSSALTNVTTEADVYVNITSARPNPVIAGHENLTYYITVGNNGPSVARDVILFDNIPAWILNPLYSIDNGTSWFNWTGSINLGNFTPGQSIEVLIRGLVSSAANSTISDTAIVNSTTYDPILENNTSNADVRIKTADIAVIKAVNNSKPNYLSNVSFTIKVINYGPDGATGVQVKDVLPVGLKFISYNATQGTYNKNTGIWDIGSLNNGSYVYLRIVAQVVKSNIAITNMATKYSENEYDPNVNNNQGNATIRVAAAADLVINKQASVKSTYLTKKVYFTITVKNYGPDTASGVYVKDPLPKGLKFASYSANYGKYNAKTGIWTIGNLGKNKVAKITIVAYAVRSGKIVNTASISSKTYDPVVRKGDSKVSSATVIVKKINRKPKKHTKRYYHTTSNTVPMLHTM